MHTLLAVLGAATLIWILAYHRLPAIAWTIAATAGMGLLTAYSGWSSSTLGALWVLLIVGAVLGNPTPLRRHVFSRPLLTLFRRILPQISQTEQEALDAGTVWWDGELFSGNPDWNRLLSFPKPALSAGERAFLAGPVEELCADEQRMADHARVLRSAGAGVAVHQGQGLSRHDHSERIRRPRFFRARAFGGGDEAHHAQRHRGGVGDGAQFARAGRTAAALRHAKRRRITTCRGSPRASRFRALR